MLSMPTICGRSHGFRFHLFSTTFQQEGWPSTGIPCLSSIKASAQAWCKKRKLRHKLVKVDPSPVQRAGMLRSLSLFLVRKAGEGGLFAACDQYKHLGNSSAWVLEGNNIYDPLLLNFTPFLVLQSIFYWLADHQGIQNTAFALSPNSFRGEYGNP